MSLKTGYLGMIIYKFGGASVKNAQGVRNLLSIIKDTKLNIVVVVSALGKTTNALEEILDLSINKNHWENKLNELKAFHYNITGELFDNDFSVVKDLLEKDFEKLHSILSDSNLTDFDLKYDQVVSFGEIFSTRIVSEFLTQNKFSNQWIDIRDYLITDKTYREAKINWDISKNKIRKLMDFQTTSAYVTQGFIGGTVDGMVTTLGREGSDFTAAVLANILNAEKVVVWKDVDGILNADPQYFEATSKLDKLSYQETVELAYFGAKVIHPKTLKPLHNKNIPLQVRSFINKDNEGTIIHCFKEYDQDYPIYILKKSQVLISLFPKDLSFVIEYELSKIFKYLSEHRIKVNIIQNSAISVSFCVDNVNNKVKKLIEHLKEDFKVLYNDQLELLTIRHYNEDAIKKVIQNRKIYIEQRSRHTAHFVIK